MYRIELSGTTYIAPDLPTLQKWADEGRVLPNNSIYVSQSLTPVRAADIPGLRFPPTQGYNPPPNPYSTGRPEIHQPAAYQRSYVGSVPNNLILAIFSTLCCCMPFGVVSIVYAAQVDGHLSRGDIAQATDSSEKAKNWAIASIVCGFIASVLYGALIFAGGMR